MSSISSIVKGPRQSNMELLRIIAMFLVLTVHADFWSLGVPTMEEGISAPLSSITRIFIEAIGILSVNIFILISGWFTIKASVKGFCNFVFQCFFFFFGIYILLICLGQCELSYYGIKICLLLTHKNWFIKAYVGLYILSPILNIFCERANRVQFSIVVSTFFIFQTIYGMSGAAVFIEDGYSTFSFIGLYLLAQLIRRYGTELCEWGGMMFIFSILTNTVLCYLILIKTSGTGWFIFNYINPIVIIGSVGLLLFFSRLNIKTNKIINWIASSAFAVFLIHGNPNIGTPYFKPFIQRLYNSYNGIGCLGMIFIALVVIFIVSVLLDQPRKWCWKFISRYLPNYKI